LRFAFAGMRPVWSRFFGAGSFFGPALYISVEASNLVITVITTPTPSSLAAEGAHRLQDRSTPARWTGPAPPAKDGEIAAPLVYTRNSADC
jgi:hypothetical protein